MLDDDSSFVRDSAVEALKKLTGQEYQTKEEWENWWNKQKPSDQSR
jgi:hypothetical protein